MDQPSTKEFKPDFFLAIANKIDDITSANFPHLIDDNDLTEKEKLVIWKFWQAHHLLEQAHALINQLIIESKEG